MDQKIKDLHLQIKTKIEASRHRKIIYFLLVALPILFICIFVYFYVFYNLPSPNSLKDYKVIPLSTHILDRNDKLLYEIFRDEKRTPVKVKDLPKYVKETTIAIEDKDFYKHGGVSI